MTLPAASDTASFKAVLLVLPPATVSALRPALPAAALLCSSSGTEVLAASLTKENWPAKSPRPATPSETAPASSSEFWLKAALSVPLTVRPSTPVTEPVPVKLPLLPAAPMKSEPEAFSMLTLAAPAESDTVAAVALISQLRVPSLARVRMTVKAPPTLAWPMARLPLTVVTKRSAESLTGSTLTSVSAMARGDLDQSMTGLPKGMR